MSTTKEHTDAVSALIYGIGRQGETYTVRSFILDGDRPAFFAFRDRNDPVYVLINEARGEFTYEIKGIFLLELAVKVTRLVGTMVLPEDSPSPRLRNVWRSAEGVPYVGYRFKVAEPGTVINYG